MKIAYTLKGADLSPCGVYRYDLWREWAGGVGTCCFVMLNPSTADGTIDDPTIRRCVRFARDWGHRRLEVRNLYPLRATDPSGLLAHPEPAGGVTGAIHLLTSLAAGRVIVGWGAYAFPDRLAAKHRHRVRFLFYEANAKGVALECLGTTAEGHPRHPLYVKADTRPQPWALPPMFAED